MSSCCVIMHHCFGKNFFTIVFTEEAKRIQICLSPEYFTQFDLYPRQPNHTDTRIWFKLYQYIYITIEAEVFAECRPENR